MKKGILCTVLSALLFGFTPVLASYTYEMGSTPETLTFYRNAMAIPMALVILPQAVRNILPALGNEFVTIIKESSIVSVISIADRMFRAKGIIAKTYNSLECLAVVAIIYFILTFLGGRLIALMERRMSYGRKK